MLSSIQPDDIESAISYDKMIQWKTRLAREIPAIKSFFQNGRVLDLACSGGRHSFALEVAGFETVGVDISPGMIKLANQLAKEQKSNAKFHEIDISSPQLHKFLGKHYHSFDAALLVGNALANTASKPNIKQVFANVYELLRKGGKFLLQTVNRPNDPFYLPIRMMENEEGKFLFQRIMIPVQDKIHNIELNVNLINDTVYDSQSITELYMLDFNEIVSLATATGFTIVKTLQTYTGLPSSHEPNSTVIWFLNKEE